MFNFSVLCAINEKKFQWIFPKKLIDPFHKIFVMLRTNFFPRLPFSYGMKNSYTQEILQLIKFPLLIMLSEGECVLVFVDIFDRNFPSIVEKVMVCVYLCGKQKNKVNGRILRFWLHSDSQPAREKFNLKITIFARQQENFLFRKYNVDIFSFSFDEI